jgi:hypothetical protein
VGEVSSGRTWAYAGLIFGAAGSVAANVGHALVEPKDAPADWEPQLGAVAWGVAVAVALLISVEVLARADWPDTKGWRAVRYAGGGVVGLVAAAASYLHLSDLLALWHESQVIVIGGPAIVDGLMVLCSFALMAPTDRVEKIEAESTAIDSIESSPPRLLVVDQIDSHAGLDRPMDDSIDSADRSAGGSPLRSTHESGGDTRSDRVGKPAGSGRRSTTRSGRRGRGRTRSDVELRADLAEAQRLGFVDRDRPTAESIRVALQCSPAKARQFRDEMKAEPAAEVPDA